MTTKDDTQIEPNENQSNARKIDEPAMAKPSALWMLVPVLLIAMAVFLAR